MNKEHLVSDLKRQLSLCCHSNCYEENYQSLSPFYLALAWWWFITAKKILQIRKRERLNFGFVHHVYSGGSVRGRWIKVNLNNLLRMGNWFWKFFPWPIHPNGYWQLSVLFPVLTQLLYDHTDNQLWFVLLLIVSPLSAIS